MLVTLSRLAPTSRIRMAENGSHLPHVGPSALCLEDVLGALCLEDVLGQIRWVLPPKVA